MVEERGRWGRGVLAAAGGLGAAGVALGAASAHFGGGDFAKLASFFLLIHAAAIPGLLAVRTGPERAWLVVASLMASGAALFSGDLAFLAFTGRTPVAGVAPLGGLMLLAAWLGVCGVALLGARSWPMSR